MVSVIGPDMSEHRRQKGVRVDLPVKELGQAVEGVGASGPLVKGRDVVLGDSCNHVIILAEQASRPVADLYAPTEEGRVEGLQPIHFSPSGSTDRTWSNPEWRAGIEAAKTGRDVENADHWRTGAARILRGLCALVCAQPGGD
jgi:hypothetical protein